MDKEEVPEKRYDNGRFGDYYCICLVCNKTFIGHKRDRICPRDHELELTPPPSE